METSALEQSRHLIRYLLSILTITSYVTGRTFLIEYCTVDAWQDDNDMGALITLKDIISQSD